MCAPEIEHRGLVQSLNLVGEYDYFAFLSNAHGDLNCIRAYGGSDIVIATNGSRSIFSFKKLFFLGAECCIAHPAATSIGILAYFLTGRGYKADERCLLCIKLGEGFCKVEMQFPVVTELSPW